ncbi:MAG: hypothetical protein ABIJ45_00140 [Candidatus Zixiibacteriota bacterium]
MAKHYGSEYAMVDYESNSLNLYLSTLYTPTIKLNIEGTFSYNISKADMDEVVMPDTEAQREGDLTHQDFTFPHMHEYSNLEYQMMSIYLGVAYKLTNDIKLTLDGEYVDLQDKDDTGWVFGDETGSYFMVRTGIRYNF